MEWCRLTIVADSGVDDSGVDDSGVDAGGADGCGGGLPDLPVVDQIARLALVARRAGGRLVIDSVCDELADLLDLVGLGIEVKWEAERREQPLGIHRAEKDGEL